MGVVLNVIWSLLAIIIAAVVCYLIYDEYIVNKPEESEAEKEIEADLIAMEAEAGVFGYDSLPDSRHAGEVPAIQSDGAAIIGENDDIDGAADGPDDASVDQASAPEVVAADVVVEETAEEEAVEVSAEEVADEAVEDAVVLEPTAEPTDEVPMAVDDLTKIKGIGKVYAERLNEAGIVSYQQIVDTDVARLEEIAKATQAANVADWSRQARALSDG